MLDALEAEVKAASALLQRFPRGAMGITQDVIKASPEWRSAKARYAAAFAKLRAANAAKRTAR